MLKESLEQLPGEFREIIVLRDLEEFSYKQIACHAWRALESGSSRFCAIG
jgi:DNA-directed RNA polymerase specialized sigma24 family protein